jgi:hypothetical protein
MASAIPQRMCTPVRSNNPALATSDTTAATRAQRDEHAERTTRYLPDAAASRGQ